MAYVPSEACVAAVKAAGGAKMTDSDAKATFARVEAIRDQMLRDGVVADLSQRVADQIAREQQLIKIAAADQLRRQAANIIIRQTIDNRVSEFLKAGLTPKQAFHALMEGSQKGVKGGRFSVSTQKLAYQRRFVADLLADVQKAVPHWEKNGYLLKDETLNADLAREMWELRDGGSPGSTKNKDAIALAKIFARHTEASRQAMNLLGASIGKLLGWFGAQIHDDFKMIKAGKDAWIRYLVPKDGPSRLDLARSFPTAASPAEIEHILGDIYDTLITGVDRKAGQSPTARLNPANLAKSLGKSRVLHFRTVEDALAYQKEFGHGSTAAALLAHQKRMAGLAGQMSVFGDNPENMLRDSLKRWQQTISRDPRIPDKTKQDWTRQLQFDQIQSAFDIMSGLASKPVDSRLGRIGTILRGMQQFAKLGMATFTAMPTDTMTAAAAAMFRGDSPLRAMADQLHEFAKGMGEGERKEKLLHLGEGLDAIIGETLHLGRADSFDSPPGWFSKMSEMYFKLNGLTGWTERDRGAAARVIAKEMGMRSEKVWGELPPRYRHVLELNGITEDMWHAIRQVDPARISGEKYVTADTMQTLPDAAVRHLADPAIARSQAALDQKIASGRATVADHAQHDDNVARAHQDVRDELEFAVARFVADETNYAVLKTDEQSRRFTTGNTRAGTLSGETMRYIMQFKGFPIAFTTRILGRAFQGGAGATKGQRVAGNLAHIGSLMAGLAIAGYLSKTAKDLAYGKTPAWPENPTEATNIALASLLTSGALGIYGDFLFGSLNSYGNTALETAAGPVAGNISSAVNLYMAYRGKLSQEMGDRSGGKYPLGQTLNLVLNNTPYANIWFGRSAMDMLFLNSLREAASPGYLHRQELYLQKNTGQSYLLPRTLF